MLLLHLCFSFIRLLHILSYHKFDFTVKNLNLDIYKFCFVLHYGMFIYPRRRDLNLSMATRGGPDIT